MIAGARPIFSSPTDHRRDPKRRRLIVNADDFGLSYGVNRGIIAAHQRGVVTSTSLMVRWEGAAPAASLLQQNRRLSVGLHIDLGEWTYREQTWQPLYEVAPLEDSEAVRREIDYQLERFCSLVGKPPTHVDSHQHVHLNEPVRTIVRERFEPLGIPIRWLSPLVTHCGGFYGQDTRGNPLLHRISLEGLTELLGELPWGITEMGCHPGFLEEGPTMYRHERQLEVRTLCDRTVRGVMRELDIQLISFADLQDFPNESSPREREDTFE